MLPERMPKHTADILRHLDDSGKLTDNVARAIDLKDAGDFNDVILGLTDRDRMDIFEFSKNLPKFVEKNKEKTDEERTEELAGLLEKAGKLWWWQRRNLRRVRKHSSDLKKIESGNASPKELRQALKTNLAFARKLLKESDKRHTRIERTLKGFRLKSYRRNFSLNGEEIGSHVKKLQELLREKKGNQAQSRSLVERMETVRENYLSLVGTPLQTTRMVAVSMLYDMLHAAETAKQYERLKL